MKITEEVLKEICQMIKGHLIAAQPEMESTLSLAEDRKIDVSIKIRLVDIGDITIKTAIGFPTGKYREEDERIVKTDQRKLPGQEV